MTTLATTTIIALPPLHPDAYSPTHHIGSPPTRFQNPWPSYKPSGLLSAFRTRLTTPKTFEPVPADRAGLVGIRTPDFSNNNSDPSALRATWIGHASFLIEMPGPPSRPAQRGMRILLDPVWSERVGPFGLVGPVRFSPPPCAIDELPHIDAVCISHDHYDHLDSDTLAKLVLKQKGKLKFFCALGVREVLVGLGVGIRAEMVTEMDWWDGMRLSSSSGEGSGAEVEGEAAVEIICTPSQHRSGRSPWSFDTTLWCSWVLQTPSSSSSSSASPQKKLFFAGDTGYCRVTDDTSFSHHSAPSLPCPAFRSIGALHGPFDLALLPIGCFKPRSVLSAEHASPEDALAMHEDVRSRRSVGMHYGTFRGAYSANYEPVTEPVERWRKGAEERGLAWGREVGVCDVGETVVV